MTNCNQLKTYLNRDMGLKEREAFLGHLASCERCKERAADWNAARLHLEKAFDARTPAFDASRASALVRAAETRRAARGTSSWRFPVLVGLYATAALAVLLVLYKATTDSDRGGAIPKEVVAPSLPIEVLYPYRAATPMPPSEQAKKILSASKTERLLAAVGQARLGLDANSSALVARADADAIRLELISGRIAVSLSPGAHRSTLSVRAGRMEVTVKGTKFLVEREPSIEGVSVTVKEGVVRVSDAFGRALDIRAGETFRQDADGPGEVRPADAALELRLTNLLTLPSETESPPDTAMENEAIEKSDDSDEVLKTEQSPGGRVPSNPRQPQKAAPPDLDTVKQWILEGDFTRSEEALTRRLAKTPDDTATLALLAVCQRKSGHPRQAVQTLKQVIEVASPAERNRARFKAGVILQDQLGRDAEAVVLFDDYLEDRNDKRANDAEARIRLAKSLKRCGDLKRYEQVLRKVVALHGGTEAAEQAGRELEQLGQRAPK